MAPSLPPVISSNFPGPPRSVMMDERMIPECAFHEAVQSKVSENLCHKVNTVGCNEHRVNHFNLAIVGADVEVRSQDGEREDGDILCMQMSKMTK
jgi:hypothetical protein